MSSRGVCVFDVDGTLYNYKCEQHDSKDQCDAHTREVVEQCKALNMHIAINTARLFLTHRVKRHLASLGIHVDELPHGAVQTRAFTSRKKVKAMDVIAQTYNVPRKNMILYDNREKNVQRVKQSGYKAVNVARHGMVHPSIALQ